MGGESILIAHAFFDIVGGGERLALELARALDSAGYSVEFVTTAVDYDKIRRIFGYDPRERFSFHVVDSGVARGIEGVLRGRFVRLRRLMAYKRFFKNFIDRYIDRYALVIDTQSNLPSGADISYIHYPALLDFVEANGMHSGFHWRLYDFVVERYGEWFLKRRTGLVLTNSTWTAGKVYRAYHVVPQVVYPPVNISEFHRYCEEHGCPHDERVVVTVSRFTPEKNLEKIVDVAKRLPSYRFIIIGSTYKYSGSVIDRLRDEMRAKDVYNIELYPDAPRNEMLSIMAHARYYLHPPFPEHFGISIVEAMAMGLVPFVYMDGGAWHDIVSRMPIVLGYKDIVEVAGRIFSIDLADDQLYRRLSNEASRVAQLFSYDRFRKNILRHVEYVIKIKRMGGII